MPFIFNTISEAEILRSPGGREMIDAINYTGPKNLIITGCPGSGKTTVTIMRALKLKREGKRILLVTYQNLLKVSLINTAGPDMRGTISGFYDWFVRAANDRIVWQDTYESLSTKISSVVKFQEILIDEGQDLEERFLKTLAAKTDRISIGSDTAQKLHDQGIDSTKIIGVIETFGNVHHVNLLYNYRNNFDTYNFARNFLPYNQRVNNKLTLDRIPKGTINKPTVFQALTKEEKSNILRTRLIEAGDVNIAILVYHKEEVDEYFDLIPKLGNFICSRYYHEMEKNDKAATERGLQNILVTTYKSAKGLEFQVVIMPNIETAMDQHFKTAEHYYVGCTRAKEQLYLIFSGEKPAFLNEFGDSTYTYIAGGDTDTDTDDDLPF